MPDLLASTKVKEVFEETVRHHPWDVLVLRQRVGVWGERTRYIYSRIRDSKTSLVPALYFYAADIMREFWAALYLLVHGFYRPSGIILRSVLGLIVSGYYRDAGPKMRSARKARYRSGLGTLSHRNFNSLVNQLSEDDGPLHGLQLPINVILQKVRPGADISKALKVLYRDLCQFVHLEPETHDVSAVLLNPQYKRDQFIFLSEVFIDIIAIALILVTG